MFRPRRTGCWFLSRWNDEFCSTRVQMSQQVNKAGLPNKSLHSDGLQPRVNVAFGKTLK